MAGYLDNYISNYAAIAAPLYLLPGKTQIQMGERRRKISQEDNISNDKTMVFFDPSRPIILRTVASYNQGLSAALLQRVYFISRTMIETEKRYSQTVKDALAIKWAKERLRVILLGAPRFRIHSAQTTVTLIQ